VTGSNAISMNSTEYAFYCSGRFQMIRMRLVVEDPYGTARDPAGASPSGDRARGACQCFDGDSIASLSPHRLCSHRTSRKWTRLWIVKRSQGFSWWAAYSPSLQWYLDFSCSTFRELLVPGSDPWAERAVDCGRRGGVATDHRRQCSPGRRRYGRDRTRPGALGGVSVPARRSWQRRGLVHGIPFKTRPH
jgi:hypothetical protein